MGVGLGIAAGGDHGFVAGALALGHQGLERQFQRFLLALELVRARKGQRLLQLGAAGDAREALGRATQREGGERRERDRVLEAARDKVAAVTARAESWRKTAPARGKCGTDARLFEAA